MFLGSSNMNLNTQREFLQELETKRQAAWAMNRAVNNVLRSKREHNAERSKRLKEAEHEKELGMELNEGHNNYYTIEEIKQNTNPLIKDLLGVNPTFRNYKWIAPGKGNVMGMFRFLDDTGVTIDVKLDDSDFTQRYTFSNIEKIPKLTYENNPFNTVSGIGKVINDIPPVFKGTMFGWSHEKQKFIYKIGELYFSTEIKRKGKNGGNKKKTRAINKNNFRRYTRRT